MFSLKNIYFKIYSIFHYLFEKLSMRTKPDYSQLNEDYEENLKPCYLPNFIKR